MDLNRRQFVLLTVATGGCAAAGCAAGGGGSADAPAAFSLVDAGPITDYVAEGVYNRFQDQGFYVLRQDGRLLALSAVCTHRRCKVDVRPDRSFACKCHGSTFDQTGRVTKGPAPRDLPELATTVDSAQHLLVRVPAAPA